MLSGVTPANRYATASVYLLPRPPANGLTFSGKIYLMLFIILAFTFPAFLKIYFFIAWKNYSGSIKTGPSMSTCLLIYFFEKVYIGKDLIVIHTTLQPFSATPSTSYLYPSCKKFYYLQLLQSPPISFFVKVPSTSLTTSWSFSAYRQISAVSYIYETLYSTVFFPYFKFIFYNCSDVRICGSKQPYLSTLN